MEALQTSEGEVISGKGEATGLANGSSFYRYTANSSWVETTLAMTHRFEQTYG